jgi:hypothetical protein
MAIGALTRVLTLEHQQDDAADQRNDADQAEPPASGKDIRDPGCFLGTRSGKPPLRIRF